jgi:hypothetical protein
MLANSLKREFDLLEFSFMKTLIKSINKSNSKTLNNPHLIPHSPTF